MFRKILNFCLNEPARSAAGRITDGARKTLGVSSRGTSEAQLNSNFTQLTNHHLYDIKGFAGKTRSLRNSAK
jgi:hypothetical protein